MGVAYARAHTSTDGDVTTVYSYMFLSQNMYTGSFQLTRVVMIFATYIPPILNLVSISCQKLDD